MSTPALDRFLKDLRDSAVVAEDSLQPLLAQSRGDDPRALALALVQAGLLTDWQAKFILSGRSRLRVGNYLLEERTCRDELGDRFIAWHQPLHRRVCLQILPENITRQSSSFTAVTNLVGLLTALDYPRVEQTFDLGEDGGRLFVVSEKSDGRLFDSPSQLCFTQGEVAGLVQGVSAGLAYLQSRAMGHGNLAGAALLLADDGLGKIVGLCDSSMRRALGLEHSAGAEELLALDRRQWVEIAERLLAKYFRSAQFAEWSRLLQQSVNQPKNLELLAERIAAWRRDQKMTEESSDLDLLAGTIDTVESVKALPQDRRTSKSPTRSSSLPKSLSESHQEVARTTNQWFKLYTLAAASIALIGLISFVAWKWWPSKAEKAPSVVAANAPQSDRLPKLSVPAEQPRPVEEPRLPKLPEISQVPPVLTAPASQASDSPAAEQALAQPQDADTPAKQPFAEKIEQSEVPSSVADAGNPAEGKKDPFLIPGQTSQPEAPAEGMPPKDAEQKDKPPMAPATSVPAPAGSRLKGFPKVTSLGEPGQGLHPIGPLPGLKFEELTLRFLYDPETVARSRVYFELQPKTEQQAWSVAMKKRTDATETEPVGEFRLAEEQLQFMWAAEVDARSLGLALANCVLQIETSQGDSETTVLREPILIEGFTFDPKTLSAETAFELTGLPNEDNLKFLLGPFAAESPWAGASVLNEDFAAKQPALVVFQGVESEQLFGLEINRRQRAKIELSAEWVRRDLGKLQKLRSSEFQRLVDESAASYANWVAESDRASRAAEDAVLGTKTRMREQATRVKNAMLESKKQNDLVQAHKAVLDGISGQEIPLRIKYQFQDRELVLAETLAARTTVGAASQGEQPNSADEAGENNRK